MPEPIEILDDDEVRVLGSLIEKAITTPEYYPLTLNALTAACSQKSNRDPVIAYEPEDVARAIGGLRQKHLVWETTSSGSRVPRYEHRFEDVSELDAPAIAALCVCMLRGPQTIGEIKGRSARMHSFDSLDDAESQVRALCEREPPLLIELPRQSGRKEPRYAHLLAGAPEIHEECEQAPPEPATAAARDRETRMAALEAEVCELRNSLDSLSAEFAAFRQQFE
jgi:uncharacterized protein YceH (UPF0502 family)